MKTFNEIEEKLNKVSVKPLSEEERGILWRKIEKGIAVSKKSLFWKEIMHGFSEFRFRTGLAFAIIVAILFGGTGVAFACEGAVPGDFLFPVAVLKEKIVISLTPTQNQNEVRLKYAEKRIEQGNDILNMLNTNVTTSTTTRALAGMIATSTTATTTPPSYHRNATSSPAVVKNAVDRLSATIAYLQGVKADLLAGGNTAAAESIQTAIDKILEQVSFAANQNATIIAKVREHKNQFNVSVSTTNAGTTTTTKLALNTKKDTQKITITEKENLLVPAKRYGEAKPIVKINDKQSKEQEKKEEKRQKNRDNENDESDDEHDDANDNGKKGFFGWFEQGKKVDVCHKGTTINIASSAMNAHLRHGDHMGTCSPIISPTPTPAPDTTAPVVSNISTNVTPTTAKITWNTDENATAVFWYGTTTALEKLVTLGTSANHQEVNLSELSSDTTYFFVIAAKDGAGNISTTTVQTFKTTVPPDTTAPVISDIVTDHTSEIATVSWKTNENATGKIYYGTSTPIVFATAPNTKLNDAYSLNHAFNLTGLATSTTYYFVLEGKDAAGNTGTSTEHQFITGS